jgi:hypothetical protein
VTGPLNLEPRRTWMEMIVLLIEAADRGAAQAGIDDPAISSVAVGADNVAAYAIELLPCELDHELDDIELDDIQVDGIELGAGMAAASVPELIRAAEQVARRHPIEQFPVGASGVIVALGDLVFEAGG